MGTLQALNDGQASEIISRMLAEKRLANDKLREELIQLGLTDDQVALLDKNKQRKMLCLLKAKAARAAAPAPAAREDAASDEE